MEDPYGIDLPDAWTCAVDPPRVVYEDGDSTVRIAVEEFAKQLSLYWWIDVYTRDGDAWARREVGASDTYRDPDVVADEVQTLVASLDGGVPDDVADESAARRSGE